MKDFLVRRPLLSGLLLFGLVWAAFTWLVSASSEGKASGRSPTAIGTNKTSTVSRPAASAPRSLQGLTVDDKHDISADGRPPNARRESIVRTGIGELQEMKQMNLAVFDDAAKRWNAQPRVKELVAQWQATEAAWKTQDDDAKAAVVPQMEAMWKEALGLLREEVEKSALEAAAGVK
jgi:hypothetical protein